MTVEQICVEAQFSPAVMPQPEREVEGIYIGDLLSWVMGRAKENDAWITIMSNINVVAVAALSDVSCVVLAEDVKLTDDVIEKANEKGINILYSAFPAFETSERIHNLIK